MLGYERIIKNLKKEKVVSFWKRLYVPERMSLIIVGDFHLEEIKGELEGLFRSRHQKAVHEPERPVPRWNRFENLPAKTPRVDIALPAPLPTSPEAPAFEVLATLLGNDLEKELNLRFFSKDYEKFRHIAFLHFAGMGRMLPSAEQVAAAVRTAVEKRLKEGFSEAEVEQAKRLILNQRLFFNDKKLHFAREIAEWEAKAGFEAMERFYRGLARLKAGDVKKAMGKTLKPLRLYVLVQKPLLENIHQIKAPHIREGKLENGLVYVYRNMSSPLLAVHLLAGRRAELEAGSGAAHLLMKTIENQLSPMAEREGLQIQATDIAFLPFDDFYLNRDFSYIRIEAPSDRAKAVKKVLEEVLLHPLDRKAFETAKKEALAELRMRLRRPCWVAEEQLRTLLLEPPLSTPIYGTLSSLKSLSYSQVERFRKAFLSPSNLIISWVGPAEPDQILSGLSELKNFKAEAMEQTSVPEKSHPAGACLCGGWKLSWNRLDRVYPGLLVLSEALKDLLAEEVREKRGLSYSLSVRPVLFPSGGYLAISVLTTPEKIKTVREVVENTLAAFDPSKISPADLRRFKMSAAGRTLRYGERKINQAFYMGWYRYLGLGADYLWKLPDLIRKVSKKDIVNLWNRMGKVRIICLPQ